MTSRRYVVLYEDTFILAQPLDTHPSNPAPAATAAEFFKTLLALPKTALFVKVEPLPKATTTATNHDKEPTQ